MQTTRRVLVNAVTRWLATLIQGALGVFLVRFLLAQLGQEGYGLTALMAAVVSFAMIADLGLGGALARHLAAQLATGDQARFDELASTALAFYLAVGSTLALLCAMFAHPITRALNVPPALMSAGVFLVRWYAAPAILLAFVSPVYLGIVTSANRFDLANWIAIGTSIFRTASLFAILSLTTAGLYGWAAGTLFSQGLTLALTAWAAYRVHPGVQVRVRCARPSSLATLFSTGAYLFALHLANLLSVNADPLILTTFIGPSAVALYTPAVTLTAAVRPLVNTLADQLHPLTTSYYERGNKQNLQVVLVRGTKYTFLLGVGACVMLGVFAEPIMRLWLESFLGTQYLVTAQVLVFWAAIDLLSYASGSQWAVLLGMNRLRFLVLTQLPFAVLNVIASAALVRFTGLGVLGVVIPTLVIGAIRRPIIIVHAARLCGVPVGHYLREAYLRPTVVLALLTGAAVSVRLLAKPSSLLPLLAWGSGLGLLFAALFWWVGLHKPERATLRGVLKRHS